MLKDDGADGGLNLRAAKDFVIKKNAIKRSNIMRQSLPVPIIKFSGILPEN